MLRPPAVVVTRLACNMKIATWNINSFRSLFEHLLSWLRTFQPDVVLLQELKMVTELFPHDALMDEGYQAAVFGQKTYNGVAILSKYRIEDINYGIENNPLPDEARYIDALIDGRVRIASVYVPNGQNIESPKYPTKLKFIEGLRDTVQRRIFDSTTYVIGGDFNIAPHDQDATYPDRWKGDVPFTPAERQSYNQLMHLGLHDAVRIKHPYDAVSTPDVMSWWDYRAGSFEKNDGLRIDHILLCPQATDMWTDAGTDRTPRTWEKPSDHTPVWCDLKI
jgi:exodeoxyribonuclease III